MKELSWVAVGFCFGAAYGRQHVVPAFVPAWMWLAVGIAEIAIGLG